MRYPFCVFVSLLALNVSLGQLRATSLSEADAAPEAAAHLLVHGRLPDEARTGASAASSEKIGDIFDRLREELVRNEAAREAAAKTAFFDAIGRPAGAEELRGSPNSAVTYMEHLQHHLAQLAKRPEAYNDVIHRAYRFVVRREAYAEELEYWKKYDTLSYALLVGCIEHWARRNQPGLMVTTGAAIIPFNSEFLTTVRLDRAVANELRIAAGLGSRENARVPEENAAADARNVVAPGAAQLIAAGGMHFVAVGGPKLAAFGPVDATER